MNNAPSSTKNDANKIVRLEALAASVTNWAERWFPDSYIFGKLISWLATIPRSEKSAVAYIALFTILASLFNWAFSLVFGGLYVRALARRTDLRVDYRAAGAAGYLGLGATWALGETLTYHPPVIP